MDISDKKNQIEKTIIDSLRILILISKFGYRKSFKLNIDKIILYDYYMKFPKTMCEITDSQEILNYSFNEYYSFFQWKPNYCDYIILIKFLLSKGLIDPLIYKEQNICVITQSGNDLLNSIDNKLKEEMEMTAFYIKNELSKKNDGELEKIIFNKYRETIRWGENSL